MEYRRIGSLDVSIASIGCNNFGWQITDSRDARAVVDAAVDEGVNFFDVADAAPNGWGAAEEMLAEAIRSRRGDLVIATKFGLRSTDPRGDEARDSTPRYVKAAADSSLRRLRTDYIDLYLIHYPDPRTPIGDTLEALGDLVAAGKVREIGCSNFDPKLLEETARVAAERSLPPLATVQSHYSVLHRHAELNLLPTCGRLGMTLVPFKPLANGLLTGKVGLGLTAPEGSRLATMGADAVISFSPLVRMTDEHRATAHRLEGYARDHGRTILDLALSYLASTKGVASVLAGARLPEQVHANVAATGVWKLTENQRAEIQALAPVAI